MDEQEPEPEPATSRDFSSVQTASIGRHYLGVAGTHVLNPG